MNGLTELSVFDNEQFGSIRVKQISGEPWFVAADVCRALEISNPSMALGRLDDDEKMTLNLTEGHSGQRGGAQQVNGECISCGHSEERVQYGVSAE